MKSTIYKHVFCAVTGAVSAIVFKWLFQVSPDTAVLILLITYHGQKADWGK